MDLKGLLMVLCLCLYGNVDGGLLVQLLIPYDRWKTEMYIFCPDDTRRCSYHPTFFESSVMGALFLPQALDSSQLLVILGSY